MEIVVLKQAEKELKDGPKELMQDIYSLFDELSQGEVTRDADFKTSGFYSTRIA